MSDSMEVLFRYAQEHMVNPLLRQEPDYADIRQCVKKHQEAFSASLGDDAQRRFDDLLDEQNLLSSYDGRALFRAGFQLAIELSH